MKTTITFEFDDDDDRERAKIFISAEDLLNAVDDIRREMRNIRRYPPEWTKDATAEQIIDHIDKQILEITQKFDWTY